MDSIDFPQLAFEFDELINGSFVQHIFACSSFSKAESLLLELVLESDHQSPKESPDLYDAQKEKDLSLQQQKIHQLKTKLILSLQGASSSSSSSSSSFPFEDQNDENDQCWIESQGLIERVFSLKQRLRDFSPHSVSSVPQILKPKMAYLEGNHEEWCSPFDRWSDFDCQLFLEEIGTRRTTIQPIRNHLQREEKSLCRSLHSIHRSLENSLTTFPSSPDLVSECQRELPELCREEMSRLLIGLEMLSLGLGIVQIPQWWIDQEQMKPMEEKNLMSINNGSEQVAQWMERNFFPSIELQLNEEEKEDVISSIKSHRSFSGCQTFYFLKDILSSWRLENKEQKRFMVKEMMITEKQRLFKDLKKQLAIIRNSETEDQNIHFFDPLSRMQRKLSNRVGTWSPPSSLSSFGFQTNAESAPYSSAAMSLKIQSIMAEINEIKRQHECQQQQEEYDRYRIQNNLPPNNEGAWDILRSFFGKEKFDIGHLSNKEIETIPEEIKYLNQKDLEWIQLKGNQVESLINRLFLIFSDNDCAEVREIGLEFREISTEELPSLFSKTLKIASLFRNLNLSKLNLQWNRLTSLPADISQLTNLQTLDISGNQLTLIPVEIGHLTNLQTLVLIFNQLTSLPAEIGQLKKLQVLISSSNQLSLIPVEIGHLINLQTLVLWNNQLTSLPTDIGQLINLQTLVLGSNQLALIPVEIGQLINLQTLQLYSNQLTSLPAEIGQLTNLKTLDFKDNQVTLIPVEIGQLINLQILVLGGNKLTSVPAEIGQLTNLKTLEIRDNQLSLIPVEIGQLINLQTLDIRNNQLSLIPIEIGQLINLQILVLAGNQLTSVVAEISQLGNVQILDFSSNKLTSVVAEIGQLKKLKKLWLDHNQLTSVPAEIGQLINLHTLDLRNNQLLSLPIEISQLMNLKFLNIENNLLAKFRDHIHASFVNLKLL